MAEISKISAVAIANVAKVDAVLKANIANINDLTIPSAVPPSATVAYSVRLLGSALGVPTYSGSCMRVREDSGDTETDIGFDSNGDLDTAAIATHCGSANGYVVTWYDQAGSNNATQSTAGNQPQIYNGTAVITENGKPAVDFDGSNSHHFVSSSNITQTGPRAEFVVTSFESTLLTDIGFLIDQDSNVTADRVCQNIRIKDGELQSINIQGGIVNVTGSTTLTANNQYLLSTEQTATALSVYVDGSQDGTASSTGSAGSQPITIGKPQRTIGPLGRYYGKMQEIVMYTSNQSSNRTGIETNINGYFSIF